MRNGYVSSLSSLVILSSAMSAFAQTEPPLESSPITAEPIQPVQQHLAEPAPPPIVQPAAVPIAPPADEPSAMSLEPPKPAHKPAAQPSVPPWSQIQLKLEIANGTSIRLGTVTQVQYEALGDFAGHDVAQNLFVRRMMLLLGGTVLHDLEYFLDTDFVDLFKASGDMSIKNGPGISLKDAFITYAGLGDVIKVDGGLMLPPLSHSSLQGAPFLYGLDFFANTYRHGAAFGTSSNAFARDVGLQLRGLLFGGVIEYRAGVFQGKRNAPEPERRGSSNPFRVAGRVQLNLLDAETGFFYRATYLGEKRLLSVGASYDFQPSEQGDYRSWAVDGLLDVAGLCAQVNFVSRDGDGFVPLPKHHAVMGEAGFMIPVIRVSPIFRFEQRWAAGDELDERILGGGLSFWAFNHTSNLKAFYVRGILPGALADYDQFNAQWQLVFF